MRGTLPPRASVWAVAAQQERETARLCRLFIGNYDAGGNASALPFRYELLDSPAGPTIFRDIDAYWGFRGFVARRCRTAPRERCSMPSRRGRSRRSVAMAPVRIMRRCPAAPPSDPFSYSGPTSPFPSTLCSAEPPGDPASIALSRATRSSGRCGAASCLPGARRMACCDRRARPVHLLSTSLLTQASTYKTHF